MSLYDRYRGHDDNNMETLKIAIWPSITTVAEVISGEITDSQAIERFNLDAGEIVEFGEAKTKITNDINALVSALNATGMDNLNALSIARAVTRNVVTQALMRAELGYDTRAEFNAALGITG